MIISIITTQTDAAQHMAGKKPFCKLDYSQAYHCLQMADQRSIEMLAFNFASRTFAHRRLAQGLSKALSAFSSFMREYLDRVIKADQCAQYVDDIGIAANDAEHLIKNLRSNQCHFGAIEIDFSGKTITPEGVEHYKRKALQTSWKKPNFRNPKRPCKDSLDPQLLQKLHTETVRKTGSLLSTT